MGGDAAHFAGTEDHDFAMIEATEDFFGEVNCDITDGGRAFLDACFGADFFADIEGALEQTIEDARGGAGVECLLIRGFDLAEDFGFAEHHGIEARDDAAEVRGGVGIEFLVEVRGDVVIEVCLEGEVLDEGGEGGFSEFMSDHVELGAVAG